MTTLSPSLSADRRVNVVWSSVALAGLAIIALLVHGYNMFGFPLYSGDEGIYMEQAYAVAKLGSITPYAYWYDHAPAGWLLLALWTIFSGGFHTFGTAVDSGRVFMLLIHVASVAALFRVTLRLTSNVAAATFAGLLFTLSPLSVIYGRMVLLDNMMMFWVLIAMALFLRHEGAIWTLLYSGLCLGVAVLTKESAIIFLPAFVYGLWTQVERHHRRFARVTWLFAALAAISLYFLYAALRKELIDFSFSSPLGGSNSVTLFGAIVWQASRMGGAPWDTSSQFYTLLTTNWLVRDPWLLGLGLGASLWNVVRGTPQRRLVALMSLLAVFGIARGAAVFDFYILPLLPLFAINVALAAEDIAKRTNAAAVLPATLVAASVLGYIGLSKEPDVFTLNLTTIQRQALAWVQEHVPTKAQIMIDDDLWVDLRDGGVGKPSFSGAHSHWKVANDPAVYRDLLFNDWKNVDYIVITPGMGDILKNDTGKLSKAAYDNSTAVQSFSVGDATVEIRKVNRSSIATVQTLGDTYQTFLKNYVSNGQVSQGGYTDAREQASAMLMAVWMNDRTTFDQLWTWTKLHLQSDSGLLYGSNQPGASLGSTADANSDAALALLLAERRWSDAGYGRSGTQIVQAIWNKSVVTIDGAPYLAAGDWAINDQRIIFAPATFAPYAYHLFAAADPEHAWEYLLDNSYKTLASLSNAGLGSAKSAGLPPTYIGIDRTTGEFVPADGAPATDTSFTADAAQVLWRVGLDAQWNFDGRAESYLKSSAALLDEWNTNKALSASYAHDGTPQTKEESLEMYSAVLPKLMVENPKAANELYGTKIAAVFNNQTNQWGTGDAASNITQQRWAWLATGLYNEALEFNWTAK